MSTLKKFFTYDIEITLFNGDIIHEVAHYQRKEVLQKLQLLFSKGYISYKGETPFISRVDRIRYKERSLK